MLKIGLTGGIGSGKSAVARLFAAQGVPVFDADEVARELVEPGQPALAAIVAEFGEGVLADGRLSRPALREKVFADAAARRALEGILHPLVYQFLAAKAAQIEFPYCVFVIPLLVETGRLEFVDRVLVVDCPAAQQRERIKRRDGLDDAMIARILAAQAGREARLAIAHDVIDNAGPVDGLRGQVEKLHRSYLVLAGG